MLAQGLEESRNWDEPAVAAYFERLGVEDFWNFS
jgi:hypothetical protein